MPIQSPCTKVCTLDPISRLCAGCGRTLDEIAAWSVLSDGERARIMTELANRITTGGVRDGVAAESS